MYPQIKNIYRNHQFLGYLYWENRTSLKTWRQDQKATQKRDGGMGGRAEGSAKGKQLLDKASRETWKDWQMCCTCQKALHGLKYNTHLHNKVRLQLCMLSHLFDKTQDTWIYPFATSIFFSIMFEHARIRP